MPKLKAITILCLSRLSTDSRLQRHLAFFTQRGFRINLVSLSDPKRYEEYENVSFYDIDCAQEALWHPPVSDMAFGSSADGALSKYKKLTRYAHLAWGIKSRKWLEAYHMGRFKQAEKFQEIRGQLPPTDIVMANDWNTLALAGQLLTDWSATGIYDTHEYATEEFADIWDWRMFIRPVIRETERQFLPDFRVVTTVSQSIGAAIAKLYKLDSAPMIVRNIPLSKRAAAPPQKNKGREPGQTKFLYLGAIAPRRGLEKLVESLSHWRADQTLTLMGPQHDGALAQELRGLAVEKGVADKFEILPPVTPNDVVKTASAYDAGLIILPTTIKQNQWAMPNKFFEYMRAGLAVVSAPLADISEIITQNDTGVVISSETSEQLGKAIAGIGDEALQAAQLAAIEYMAELNWSQDYESLLARIEEIV